jgi:LacI family transcriptional regulator
MPTDSEPAAGRTRRADATRAVPPRKRADGDPSGHRVTVKDVARVAGVSHGTVSKALNASPEVSDETRARIVAVANGLGYRPNAIARSLKARQSHTLGVITNDNDGVLTTAMVRGVTEVASEHGFGVFLCNSYGRSDKERQHLQLLQDKQVDAVILTGYKVAEREGPVVDLGATPVIYLYEYTAAADAPCILPDDEAGAHLATMHLHDLGRRRIAFLNGPPSFEATAARMAGYRRALHETKTVFTPSLVRVSPDWNQDSAFHLAQQLAAQDNPPDALVCASDDLAAGAILGLRELGLRVPVDVSVVGFDDRPFAAHLPTALTTVALPLYAMGVQAALWAFDALAGRPVPRGIARIPCELVVRASCGAHLG